MDIIEIELKIKNGIKLSKEEKDFHKLNNKEAKEKKSKMSLGERLKSVAKSEYAQLMGENEEDQFPIRDWISTGNYILNSQISSDIKKGIPSGRIFQLSGLNSVGKSYIAINSAINAQKQGYFIILYDTEFANNDKNDLKERGLDLENLLYIPIDTVENIKTSILNILEESKPSDKIYIIVDSIGNLSTRKELEDSISGESTRDMTRAAQLKALFRTCTLKAGIKNIPITIINHVYSSMGFMGGNEQAGGCLTKKSKIKTDKGLKNINKVKVGDYVETLFGLKKVLSTFEFKKPTKVITLENGYEIIATNEHKFLIETNNGYIWKCAEDLLPDDYILLQ